MTPDDDAIIVTGASRGLGRSMCERFAAKSLFSPHAVRNSLRRSPRTSRWGSPVVQVDARDADDVEQVVGETVDTSGRVDTLVNNAGVSILGTQDDRNAIQDVTEAEYDTVPKMNLDGVFLFTREAHSHTYDRGRGNVINIPRD